MGELKRYGVIESKNKREIVLLQGLGCRYKRCLFCDYYLDVSPQYEEINHQALSCVEGRYGILEIINSGSFGELSQKTLEAILHIAHTKKIKQLIFECHYLYRDEILDLKKFFDGIEVKVKLGLESFNVYLREKLLKKGICEVFPNQIAHDFDEANLLVGLAGQSIDMIEQDIVLGLEYFERICVNVMCDNSKMHANQAVIDEFLDTLYPLYKDEWRIDFLLDNTDFGVG
ncbi:hypothetical protein [Helicobacter pametensis]|uniref:hypothetical protein n=1 Tax=Helicobacter pametensis TaxID=95149 RepID=UPI0018F82415|nr:hypothetical protein [Helicobacter pametensis]